jgi:hypothetical protein
MGTAIMTNAIKDITEAIRDNKPTDMHGRIYHAFSSSSRPGLPTRVALYFLTLYGEFA